jgi:hypothetical protein
VTGIQQYVMSYEVGVALEDSQWQAPAHCFLDEENTAERAYLKKSVEQEVVDGLPAGLLKKLAGAAATAF